MSTATVAATRRSPRGGRGARRGVVWAARLRSAVAHNRRRGQTAPSRQAEPAHPIDSRRRNVIVERRMYIGNQWVGASGGAVYQVPNPATEEVIGSAPDATVDDMKRAIGAARKAFDEGPWRKASPADRAKAIEKIADAMERRK